MTRRGRELPGIGHRTPIKLSNAYRGRALSMVTPQGYGARQILPAAAALHEAKSANAKGHPRRGM
jgi:hypothetical protein